MGERIRGIKLNLGELGNLHGFLEDDAAAAEHGLSLVEQEQAVRRLGETGVQGVFDFEDYGTMGERGYVG